MQSLLAWTHRARSMLLARSGGAFAARRASKGAGAMSTKSAELAPPLTAPPLSRLVHPAAPAPRSLCSQETAATYPFWPRAGLRRLRHRLKRRATTTTTTRAAGHPPTSPSASNLEDGAQVAHAHAARLLRAQLLQRALAQRALGRPLQLRITTTTISNRCYNETRNESPVVYSPQRRPHSRDSRRMPSSCAGVQETQAASGVSREQP